MGVRWAVWFSVVELLFWLGYGAYHTYTRMYVADVLGQDYPFMAVLVGAEEAPLLLALAFGGLADAYGRRRLVLLGLGEAAAVAAMGFVDVRLLPALAAVAAAFYTVAYTAVTGIILAGSGGSGRLYSLVTLWGSVGWALGGVAAGALYPHGPGVVFAVVACLVAASYLVAYAATPPELDRGGEPVGARDVLAAAGRLAPLVASTALSSAGLAAFYGAAALKLRAEVGDPVLYGLVYSALPALLGALARIPAGALVDRCSPALVLAAATAAYLALNYAVAVARGALLVAAWLVPLYPFREVAAYVTASRLLPPSLQATAGAAMSLSTSAAGLIAMAVAPLLEGGMLRVYAVTSALLAASLPLLAPYLGALSTSTGAAPSPSPRPRR